jgi:hypothetical protein
VARGAGTSRGSSATELISGGQGEDRTGDRPVLYRVWMGWLLGLVMAVLISASLLWWCWWVTGDDYVGVHVGPAAPGRHRAYEDEATVTIYAGRLWQ